jgi:manganese peroxidase
MASFQSDINLSKNASSAVGKQFATFVGAQAAWGASFSSAFQFMSNLGVPRNVKAWQIDCTTPVAAAFPS